MKHVLNFQKIEKEKNCNFENYDFVIFCDGDWSMHEGFSEEKILSMLERLKNEDIDFLFERPAGVGGGKSNKLFAQKGCVNIYFSPCCDCNDRCSLRL